MVGKRKAAASSPPSAKRITRSVSAAATALAPEPGKTEVIKLPTHAADEALSSEKSSGSTGRMRIVAFLRGVNVGGRTHSMKSIADALGKAGLCNVDTFLASGNVIFDAPGATLDQSLVLAIEHRVEDALEKLFGCHIPVFARSMDEVDQLGRQVVRSATAVNVVLLKQDLTDDQRGILEELSTDAHEIEPLHKAFVLYSSTKISESPLFRMPFDKKLGVPVTMRTVTTLRRIAKKFG